MKLDIDVLVIGTGTAAHYCAHGCARAGLSVAVVDERRYGGTCARRGCQPKKFLVAATEVVGLSRDLVGQGVAPPAQVHWTDLMASKRRFTEAVPARTEKGFAEAGITCLHGHARFLGPDRVFIEGAHGGEVTARTVVIATGAAPTPLPIDGAHLLTTSEDFLELDGLPRRLVCVGGGFISLEFAHVANRAGVAVTIVHRGPRLLESFDADLAERLTEASRAVGIEVHCGVEVAAIVRQGNDLIVRADEDASFPADVVLHGAGRRPQLAGLDLAAAEVAHTAGRSHRRRRPAQRLQRQRLRHRRCRRRPPAPGARGRPGRHACGCEHRRRPHRATDRPPRHAERRVQPAAAGHGGHDGRRGGCRRPERGGADG